MIKLMVLKEVETTPPYADSTTPIPPEVVVVTCSLLDSTL
jgi:hypothetical protein